MNPSAPTPDPRTVDGFPCLIWRCPRPWLAISSAPYGGGIGVRHWVLNSTVHRDYARPDPCEHVREMVRELGLSDPGVGMLTAVDVRREITVVDGLAAVSSTTGATHPIWAAAPEQVSDPVLPGTINAVCWSAVRLSEAALVNAVSTVAEAKAQALWESNVDGTGTVTDATTVMCPADGPGENYGGPRSRVGAALARAVRSSVTAGLRRDGRSSVSGYRGSSAVRAVDVCAGMAGLPGGDSVSGDDSVPG